MHSHGKGSRRWATVSYDVLKGEKHRTLMITQLIKIRSMGTEDKALSNTRATLFVGTDVDVKFW